ncbi:MAG: nuclear transport factor 2 family protein [Actinomycetota bacterium]|nr:nuclear transport factor 2 family protein [Actinomycetota bacterium]
MQTIDSFLEEWASAEGAGDADRLDGLLTADFLGVGPLGFVLPKTAWLGRYQSGALIYRSFTLEEVQTRLHGAAAVVTARQTSPGHYQGQPTPEVTRVTLVAVSDAACWQLAGAHSSFMAGSAGSPPLPAAADPRPGGPGDA